MLKWTSNIFYSFPIQLLVFHFRGNLLLVVLWTILILFFSGLLGAKLGFQYLFLDPEYLGNVDFWSFLFLGIAYGGFVMSWNLTTYLLSAHHFPFLATLVRPFTKFSLNNFLFPIIILAYYVGKIVQFQYNYESLGLDVVFLNCLGLLFGGFAVILFYSIYFHITNRDITYYQKDAPTPPNLMKSIAPGHRNVNIDYIKLDDQRWKVRTFLNESFQPRIVRSVAHYDSKLIKNIFKQNHLNALIIQLCSMLSLILLGYLIDYPVFRIPAGASILILMSILVAIIGALTYWFNQWTTTVIILLVLIIDGLAGLGDFRQPHRAFGIDYDSGTPEYSYESLQQAASPIQVEKDKHATTEILTNWKKKVSVNISPDKPKLVILAVSGGGLKSALWTLRVIQEADSTLEGRLLDHTVLITGASGGMIGVAYLREQLLRMKQGQPVDIYSPVFRDSITQDLLNSVAFSLVSKDLFLPRTRFRMGSRSYPTDRGFVFEQHLNENTGTVLDKPLGSYRDAEKEAVIPMVFITPSIVNDARRLIISPQRVSYMMVAPVGVKNQHSVEIDAVDFGLLFSKQDAQNLRFLSALRMNATYPYVLPNVHLPSAPAIEVMDAGFLDNYGIFSATRFLQVFREWILANTSGAILVQISTSQRIEQIMPSDRNGIIESLVNPLGIAGKVFVRQQFEFDNSIGFIFDLLGHENFQVIRFICHPSRPEQQEASISYHLTRKEKQDVIDAFALPANQESLGELRKALQKENPLDHLPPPGGD